jgi:multisubunit Na+/H+ antiporter MnhB subunit
MFAIEAHASLAIAVLLLLALRNIKRELPSRSSIDLNVLLVLGFLFCTIAGYFVLQPMMATAKAGEGSLSFGALHGLAGAFFALKALAMVWLAWRLTAFWKV